MTRKLIPKVIWYFGLVYEDELLSIISIDKENWNGYEEVTGQTLEIGYYLYFEL